jgi:DNA-binding transcriptional regulator YiaG
LAKSWKDVRAQAQVDEERVAAARDQILDEQRAYKLAEIRKGQHVTQAVLAAAMSVSQARVSKTETRDLSSTELGTLQPYVENLGGKLKVIAEFGDETITVRG